MRTQAWGLTAVSTVGRGLWTFWRTSSVGCKERGSLQCWVSTRSLYPSPTTGSGASRVRATLPTRLLSGMLGVPSPHDSAGCPTCLRPTCSTSRGVPRGRLATLGSTGTRRPSASAITCSHYAPAGSSSSTALRTSAAHAGSRVFRGSQDRIPPIAVGAGGGKMSWGMRPTR